MIKFDLLIFLRSLRKRSVNTIINLTGLSAGITCVLLIAVYLKHELSFDQHQKNKNRIYRMALNMTTNSGSDVHTADNFPGLAPLLNTDFPEVEKAARIYPYKGDVQVNYQSGKNPVFKGDYIYRTEPEIFKVFDHKFIIGNPKQALSEPRSIVLTEALAKKYFGEHNPLNKSLTIDNTTYKVTGIIKDLPKASDLYYEALLSYDFSDLNNDWGNIDGFTYVLFKNNFSIESFQVRLDEIVKEKTDAFVMRDYELNSKIQIFPQALSNIHFEKPLLSDTPKGNLAYINILKILGLVIFLIIVFNYGNYTASYYTERIKDISIRKYFGASRRWILLKTTLEMSIISALVISISIILYSYFAPFVNELTNNAISIKSLLQAEILFVIAILLLITIAVSLLYPVVYLVNIKPKKGLTGVISIKGNNNLRRGLMGIQFFCTAIMIFFTLTVFQQIQFLENKNLGFNSNQVLVINIPELSLNDSKTQVLKSELNQLNSVKKISVVAQNAYPGNRNINYQYGWLLTDEEKIEANFNLFEVDENFTSLLDIELVNGNKFTNLPNYYDGSIYAQAYVNESFVKKMGLLSTEKAIGKIVYAFDYQFKIIDVVKDFHYEGIHQNIKPLLIYNNNQFGTSPKSILAEINNKEGLAQVINTCKKFNSSTSFEHKFLDEEFDKFFQQERTIGKITYLFCIISIILASIGLYAVSSLFLVQRTKEIGIRKVLGAGSFSISTLLFKELFMMVIITFLLSMPFSWFQSNLWLEQFTYKIEINWLLFVFSGMILILASIAGIIINLIKGINLRPVELLRDY
ncbi:ABC transporter permease [Chondrinema litorale]|uniref:ABC transporter permease n=1 Tax=Chondrinema litorale TaxID=2994555 RepID=UPI002542C19D|nr:ABC transporter permease [Chondrinema litorale]UZR96079.1 ABC transporter permease [Chondrinema litorale]